MTEFYYVSTIITLANDKKEKVYYLTEKSRKLLSSLENTERDLIGLSNRLDWFRQRNMSTSNAILNLFLPEVITRLKTKIKQIISKEYLNKSFRKSDLYFKIEYKHIPLDFVESAINELIGEKYIYDRGSGWWRKR